MTDCVVCRLATWSKASPSGIHDNDPGNWDEWGYDPNKVMSRCLRKMQTIEGHEPVTPQAQPSSLGFRLIKSRCNKQNTCDQGIIGMQVGGKRELRVPAHLGYGERSVGSIPPNSNLRFEIELLEVLTRDD